MAGVSVAVNLAKVQERIAAAAHRAGRLPGEVTLVAVAKGHGPEAILEAYHAGQRDFGESRAQELVEKASQLPPDIRWHFVGPLQRNKVRQVRPCVVLLHSLDRLGLARSWARGVGVPPPILVEVNVGGEEKKLGGPPDTTEELVERATRTGLNVQGLMTIPPRVARPEEARSYFLELAGLRDRLAPRWPELQHLSMGMSEDFEVAVEAGSTMLRIGRAIFQEVQEAR
jgi:pyridoxal phosphate enzyme (YggS family)